jgi:hypothetical protein
MRSFDSRRPRRRRYARRPALAIKPLSENIKPSDIFVAQLRRRLLGGGSPGFNRAA